MAECPDILQAAQKARAVARWANLKLFVAVMTRKNAGFIWTPQERIHPVHNNA